MRTFRPAGPGTAFVLIVAGACGGARQAALQNAAPAGVNSGSAPALAPTGAVTSLAEMAASGTLGIEEYLRGRVPGLQVIPSGNGGFTLRLRGPNLSLASGREVEPLVVIDGMPVAPAQLSQVLGMLHPSDIRSIRVLRDVASTSVYGTRAASGVIRIRTIR